MVKLPDAVAAPVPNGVENDDAPVVGFVANDVEVAASVVLNKEGVVLESPLKSDV